MTRIHPTATAAVVATLAGACAPSGSSPAGGPVPAPSDTVYVVDTIRVGGTAAPDPTMEERVARLEIMLLERDARLAELQRSLDQTRREVVRNLAKLQSQASRAEAASGLAEAEIALQTLARVKEGAGLPGYREAQARLEEGSVEFGRSNYGGALYLATEARSLAGAARSRLSATARQELLHGETLFATSVPLQTGPDRANVRRGPGMDFEVLHTLEPETELVGQSYSGEWVRVADDGGREGWIFHTLVTAR